MNSEHPRPEPHSPGQDPILLTACTALGAVLIHLVAALLAFLKGAILGAGGGPVPMAPTPMYGTVQYGFDGGIEGVNELGVIYFFTFGIVPVLLSAMGGAAGFFLGRRAVKFGNLVSQANTGTTYLDRPYFKLTVMWASSLFLVQFCLARIILIFGGSIGYEYFLVIFFGLAVTVWTVGSIAAYVRHRDWRIPVLLIVIALLLRMMSFWLPGYGLLILAIGTLLFLMRKRDPPQLDDHSRIEFSEIATRHQYPTRQTVDGLTMFVLGGISFYTLVCQFVFLNMLSESKGSENWGLGMFLILGLWGIPVFGGIALCFRRQASRLPWLTTLNAWLMIGFEVCVCALVWLLIIVLFG